jgi:opacity protein-like surface antigen
MLMRTLFAMLLLLCSATSAGEMLQGFYVAGGLMNQHISARIKEEEGLDGVRVLIDSSSSRNATGGTLLAGYQLPLGTQGIALIETGTDLVKDSHFSTHGTSSTGDSIDSRWKVSRQWFLAFKPGIRLSDKLVAYTSLAYHRADVDFSTQVNIFDGQSTRTGMRSVDGIGIGLGLQGPLSDRLFFRGEVEGIQYSRAMFDNTPPGGTFETSVSRHSLKPTAVIGRLVLGYRF